jgi:hypothetical protein
MNTLKKITLTVGGLAALALGGSAIANATSGSGNEKSDAPDTVVAGTAASKAGDAALTAVGGGKVVSVEGTDEGGPAVYEVKVDNAGKVTEVQVDKAFSVTSQKADDKGESQDKGDGDGETADDQNGAQDKGDGDGETNDG